ncbi:MAG: hypothetical protein JW891_10240 [Candidatus Lokiarchaeota archaeon]|nr:hypothetical protein [Candidatus Lokiarchaeota archaeon]
MQSIDKTEQPEFLSTSGAYKIPFTFVVLLQLLFGGLVLIAINLWFFNHIYILLTGNAFYSFERTAYWWEWLLFPLNVYGNFYLFSFSIIAFSALINTVLNKLSPPQEGVFERGSKDWKYAHRRFWTAYFPIWLVRALPLPWLDIAAYKFFGVRIGRAVVAYEGYIDPLFVEIGDQTMTSLHICIFSHLIYHDKMIIKKVKVGENCIVGPHSILFPGTIMKDNAIIGANSYTKIDQVLEGNLIHIGKPATTQLSIQSSESTRKKLVGTRSKLSSLGNNKDDKKEV